MTVSGKKTPAARPKASYTVKAITTKAEDLADHRERVAEAVAWCGANRRGARAAETHFKKIWGEGVVTYNMIQPILTRLNKKSKAVVAARDHHLQLLTNDERLKVGAWIIQWRWRRRRRRASGRSAAAPSTRWRRRPRGW